MEATKLIVAGRFLYDMKARQFIPIYDQCTLGRLGTDLVFMQSKGISKRHAQLVFRDNKIFVTDLGSTNGTYINGRKVTKPEVELKLGHKLRIGDRIFVLTDSENPAALPKRHLQLVSRPAEEVKPGFKPLPLMLQAVGWMLFWIGVISVPYVFAWFTMKKSRSDLVCFLAFLWFGVVAHAHYSGKLLGKELAFYQQEIHKLVEQKFK